MDKRQGRSNTSLSNVPYSSARALRGETLNSGIEMMLYTTDEGQEIWTRVAGRHSGMAMVTITASVVHHSKIACE
jgi:hypothetical protein